MNKAEGESEKMLVVTGTTRQPSALHNSVYAVQVVLKLPGT